MPVNRGRQINVSIRNYLFLGEVIDGCFAVLVGFAVFMGYNF